jgi:hypothetical protein
MAEAAARRPIRMANCSAPYGDLIAAAMEMLAGPIDVLTVAAFRSLLPESAALRVRRYDLPNLRAVDFVVEGLLTPGIAATSPVLAD